MKTTEGALPCPSIRKINICGEEEREKIPPFEEWKELSLQELYKRTEAPANTTRKNGDIDPSTGNRRQRISEYHYTNDIDAALKYLQHTRADKVRECRKEAKEIFERDGCHTYNTIEEVYEHLPALAETEDFFVGNTPLSALRFGGPNAPKARSVSSTSLSTTRQR